MVLKKHVEMNGACSMPDSVDNARTCVKAWNHLRATLNGTRSIADKKPEFPEDFFVNICMVHVLQVLEDGFDAHTVCLAALKDLQARIADESEESTGSAAFILSQHAPHFSDDATLCC